MERGSSLVTFRIWNLATSQLLSFNIQWTFSFGTLRGILLLWVRIISVSNNKTTLVWDAQSGQIVWGPITEHEGVASSVCFSPDGKLVPSRILRQYYVWMECNYWTTSFSSIWRSRTPHKTVCFFPYGQHFDTGPMMWQLEYGHWTRFPMSLIRS